MVIQFNAGEWISLIVGLSSAFVACSSIAVTAWIAISQMKQAAENVNRQLVAEVASKSRQKWLDDLRNMTSEFLSLVDPDVEEPDRDQRPRRMQIVYQIQLMLNLNEPEHQDINQHLQAVALAYEGYVRGTKEEFLNEMSFLQTAVRKTLKKTWEEVKSLN